MKEDDKYWLLDAVHQMRDFAVKNDMPDFLDGLETVLEVYADEINEISKDPLEGLGRARN